MSSHFSVEQRILLCIDEVLETLGHEGRRVVLGYLKKCDDFERGKILREPELFCKELTLVLGERGAKVIELSIVQKLASRFELKEKKSELTLTEAIGMIRNAARKESFKDSHRSRV